MKIQNYFLIAVGGALIGAATGFVLQAYDDAGQPRAPTPVKSVKVVDVLPAFSYPDLDGRQRSGDEFGDRVLVLNFWATWCPPCRKETPEFVALQKDFGDKVQFLGIAIDDEDKVREFAEDYAVNYPLLLGDVDAIAIARRLGNRYEGLPFTVVIAPGGEVVMRHTGGLERDRLEPLLRDLTKAG